MEKSGAISGSIPLIPISKLFFERLDFSVRQNARTLDAYIELDRKIPMHQFIKNMRELDLEISNLQLVGENDYAEETIPFTVTVNQRKNSTMML